MILNNKELVFDMVELPQTDEKQGTVGVGINGMKAEFSDMQMDCLSKSAFIKYIESIRKKDEITVDEITQEDMTFDSATSANNTETAQDEEKISSYDPCLSMSNQELRNKWLIDNVNPTEVDKVEFCPSCCMMLATLVENADCMTQCMASLIPPPPSDELFDGCFVGNEKLATVEQRAECIVCVQDVKRTHPEIEDKFIILKKAECGIRFKRCDNPFECTTSWAEGAHGA